MLSLADEETICEHFPELIERIKTDPVRDELYRLKVLTRSDTEDIMAERTTSAKNRKMLDIILKGKKDDKLHLIAALNKAEQTQLADLLEHGRRSGREVVDAKKILKDTYLKCFKTTNPFSLPFKFDIEKTWVSLGFKEEKNPKTTEDYNEIIKRAFKKDEHSDSDEHSDIHQRKVLIIEGKPATGKTCLMRRIAFDGGKDKMEDYDLVLYAEFRSLDTKSTNIVEIIIRHFKKLCQKENQKKAVENLLTCSEFFEENRVLLLLDGYDESSPEKYCEKLEDLLHSPDAIEPPCDIVISTRPGYLTMQKGCENRFVCAQVLGFTTQKQKSKYISNHFPSTETDFRESIEAVEKLLKSNELNKIAETPLLLTFICLVHDKIFEQQIPDEKRGNNILLDLYCNIIWWLLNRYQKSHQNDDVPHLFGYPESKNLNHKLTLIQDNYLEFPQVHLLSEMALQYIDENKFSQVILEQVGIDEIILKVGLMQISQYYEIGSYRIATDISFLHRTIQELLAAVSYFSTQSRTQISSIDIKDFMARDIFNKKILTGQYLFMTEYEKFLWRIATSDKFAISAEIKSNFFESYSTLVLDLDIFSSSAKISFGHLKTYLVKCSNVTRLFLKLNSMMFDCQLTFTNSPVLEEITFDNGCTFLENSQLTLTDLPVLNKMTFDNGCTFLENSQLTLTDLPVLNKMRFNNRCTFLENSHLTFTNLLVLEEITFDNGCTFQENSQLTLTDLPVLNKMTFSGCSFQPNSHFTFTDLPVFKKITFIYGCTFQENSQLTFTDLPALKEMTFGGCKFQANSQLTFTNLPVLKEMTFDGTSASCIFQENSHLTFTDLPALELIAFNDCKFQEKSQLTLTNLPALKEMTFGGIFGGPFGGCTFQANSQLTFTDLPALKEMTFGDTFGGCLFQENSHFTFTDLSALEQMTFKNCTFQEKSQLTLTNLPVLERMEFNGCTFQDNSQKISRKFTFTAHNFSLLANNQFMATFHEITQNHRSD